MMAPARFKGVCCMLLVVSFFAPTAVLAQQDNGTQAENQQGKVQQEQPQAKTEAAQSQPEAPQANTEAAQGQTAGAQAPTEKDPKVISGMSILGNQEAPKSLVIVPWKSSEIGTSMGISTMLDDSRQPVDKEVFMRALRYYEIRSETKR
jgi:hemolysin activation/secretion protein